MQLLSTIIKFLLFTSFVVWLTACGGGDGDAVVSNSVSTSFDANGDGKADLFIETGSDAMPWRFGLSTGEEFDTSSSLTQAFDASSYSTGKAIAVADANADGKDDVLVQLKSVDGQTQWKVYLSDGTSSTETVGSISMPTGDDARALAFTDIDGDGLADILIQQQVNGVAEFYISRGSGFSFSAPEMIYSFDTALGMVHLIALEDINGDGSADLVFDQASRGSHCYFVRVFKNGSFEGQPLSTDCKQTEDDFDLIETSRDGIGEGGTQTVKRIEALGVADMTGDGNSELVYSITTNILSTRRISSTPGAVQFITSGQASTAWYYLRFVNGPSGTEWGDIPQQFGFENTPTAVSTSHTGVPPTTVDLVDLNNDGRTDLLYEISSFDQVSNSRTISVKALIFRSSGVFEEQLWLDSVINRPNAKFGMGDFDGDGRLDLSISAYGKNSALQDVASATIYINDGSQFIDDRFGFSSYLRFDVPGKVRILFPNRDGLTTVAHDTGSLIAWAGTNNTKLYTHNEFKDLMTGKGFAIKTPSDTGSIKPGECQAVYASADNDDLSVEFGTLMCLDFDGVTVRQQYIYGGCDLANQGGIGGVGGQCEIGTFRTDIGVNIAGIDQNLGIEGPRAGVCSAVSLEFSCIRTGVQLASVSGKTMIGNTGVGAGVSIGLGGGASFGAEDGVLSGVIDLQLGIGITIEFSFDYEKTGEFVLKHGETAYVFIRDDVGETVISAGKAIIDAVNAISDTGDVLVGGIEEGIGFVGGVATTIGGQVIDLFDDAIDAISDFFGF